LSRDRESYRTLRWCHSFALRALFCIPGTPVAIWLGVLHGRKIRKSLDLRSWAVAQKLVRDWEANPEGGGMTVKIAVEKYLSDAEARNISDSQMRELRLVLGELERNYGPVAVRSITLDDLRTITTCCAWNEESSKHGTT
jgi:hypothetical protein